ncbi:capsid maturation protease and MuF-like fusion protein [Mycobacterium phage Thonko]|uniref:Capsid maturation protease and MuF-like fusion protein n=1 Tax=Mycobacterium phage Thonko TaxID=2282910 RepID=A0A346FC55_9CAUD|nr:portal protein [Mycobacterium phage Thonko]AXN53280.1 capsid maturation protease and MuF-like fusion protein [Mycobacterium phage Thonko]
MWPQRGEALSRTIEAEAALTDLYAEALNEWITEVVPFVLPALTAAGELPPEPDAVVEPAGRWDQFADALILSGLSTLWAISAVEATEGFEIDLPEIDLPEGRPKIDRRVLRALAATSDLTEAQVREAVERVESDPELRQQRDDFIEQAREAVSATPAIVRDKLAAAVRDIEQAAAAPTAEPSVEVDIVALQRSTIEPMLRPGSDLVRDVSREQGYQAAGVQNAAVIAAAMRNTEDVLDKVWIATIDGKTRHTHFAADGQRTPLAGTFTVGGEALRFPGDPLGPAREVRNCRCRVGVLADDEPLPDEVDRHTERLNGRDSVQINRVGTQRDEIDRRKRAGTVRARDDEDGIGRTAAGGWSAPSEGIDNMTEALATDTEQGGDLFRTFTDQPIAFIGIETSDGRMLAADIDLTFRSFPLPLMWCEQSAGGHLNSYVVGALEDARIDGDRVLGSGYLLNSEESDKAADLLGHGVIGPSVDLAATKWKLTDEKGNEISEEDLWDLTADDKIVQTITAGELIGTTLVATPAFGDTKLALNSDRESRDIAVVASAAEEYRPRVYAAELFAAPNLTEPTLPTMDPETGRIFGHLACFGQCHRSIQSQCVMAPRSRTNYSHFHTSPAVRLDDGTSLPVGRLTVGTGHAPDSLRPGPALAHYDNTGTCFALVRVYETEVGIEFSGVAAPWATAEQVEMGLSAPLSGDWRDFGQGLELIAALAVNTPGFAARGREDENGRPVALVASLGPAPSTQRGGIEGMTVDDIAAAVVRAIEDQRRAAELAAEREAALAEAAAKVGPPPEPKTPADEIGELLAEAGV